jgi:hypothetical protein
MPDAAANSAGSTTNLRTRLGIVHSTNFHFDTHDGEWVSRAVFDIAGPKQGKPKAARSGASCLLSAVLREDAFSAFL